LKELLTAAVTRKPADYVEVRVEESVVTDITYRGKDIDNLGQSVRFGGNARALVNGGWGFVSFNSLDALDRKVDQAINQAKLVSSHTSEKSVLAPVPVVVASVPLDVTTDARDVPLARKKEVLDGYNSIILDYGKNVTSSSISYFDHYRKLYFANSEGTYVEQERMDVAGSIIAIATRGADTQQGRAGFGSTRDWNAILGLDKHVLDACDVASQMLDAPPVTGGQYTVVLDPFLAGVFAHEAFGHLSEADNVYENPELQKVMVLGRRFGRPELSIYDSGLDEGARGYLLYDDEGVKTEKTYLIKEGLLVGRLHSRATAGKMRERPTGNARAQDYRYAPIVRMRNTSIEKGQSSFEDMVKDVRLGVYAIQTYGGQTNGEMFTFSAGQGYMIRDGKVAELVRDVNLTGNVFQTLQDIDMVGADFCTHEMAGGCGKADQGPLPTSEWAPHIRIKNVVVGGSR